MDTAYVTGTNRRSIADLEAVRKAALMNVTIPAEDYEALKVERDEAFAEIERLQAENAAFAKAIVLGDEHFTGEEWEATLVAAERIVPLPSN
jgi:S-adenosylmethionine:diacylglycerol 3-amino-3-carboxypropyl transferase